LFTVPLDMFDKISLVKNVKVIGHITDSENGCVLTSAGGSETGLTAQGWDVK
jgi:thiamine-monophosphate kinase